MEPWQKAEIPGPVKAVLITKPEVVAVLIKRAKRPLFVVGTEVLKEGGGKPLDYAVRIARAGKVPVVATAQMAMELKKRGLQPAARMAMVEICSRLTDPKWSLHGDGQPHDLVLMLGLGPYYMEWLMGSGLKSFAPHLRTISLNRFYQPHCSWSFPNLPAEEWYKNLEKIAEELEK
ncbi:MAG: CO dehydrogenase/acetyl-CoA synthase complex subunit epsilon [Hadesarchaea archaeon]|nr:MAG: CO dehydrogenase/acetyl-CoA synthase complex subunit epsilon [Hadesarchaea archaeon]TDA35315.1 MAG: CO dehydrogenase/acetyl-CoA synthase complex subunit epsilon [Hadesarchaea archaeon]